MTRTGSRTLSSPVCEPHRYLSTSSSHNVFSYYVFFRESVASTLQPPPVGAGMCPLVNVIATEILYLGGSSQHSTIQVRQTATTWSPNTTRECNRPHRYGAVPPQHVVKARVRACHGAPKRVISAVPSPPFGSVARYPLYFR